MDAVRFTDQEVACADAIRWVGKVELELCYGGRDCQRMRAGESSERGNFGSEPVEKFVRIGDIDHRGGASACEFGCFRGERATAGRPPCREAAVWLPQECCPKCGIPCRGPAADDHSIFIEQ